MSTATPRRRRVPPVVWGSGGCSQRAAARATEWTTNAAGRWAGRSAGVRGAGIGRGAVVSVSTLEADVNMVVMVGERERGPAETEQGDHLLGLELCRKPENCLHGLLGHAARLLVTRDRNAAERGDVDAEPKDVCGDDTGTRVE